ncbi:MAG: SUMF1/EgtB/PvdO family nonheme iron enzyme [Alphaproteobacteria bacterium]|nr:SUMF1/EgtB/PvdO family nonheme iron enzyme [Alphaproteobacteria bacterium]
MKLLFLFVLSTLAFVSTGRSEVPIPELISVPAGPFIRGSDTAEREAAYRLDEAAYGHSVTRKNRWYESEFDRASVTTDAYEISKTLITNQQYAAFVAATGHRAPDVDRDTWRGYGLIHPYTRTRRHAWSHGTPPEGREDHPVVLVSHDDARAYAAWLSKVSGVIWRLATETEWEKAARGVNGNRFPWGENYDPARLNSHDRGPFDTLSVHAFPDGASPFGLFDPAGQVFEWTATAARGIGRYIVKGGSWDDSGCGICRPAARHSRPEGLKHILVGFRLVREKR